MSLEMEGETWPLLVDNPGLSLPFAALCIVDLFGVFPIVALPSPVIDCGWGGIPLALVVFGLQVYTAILLGRCWIIAECIDPRIVSKNRYPYSALVEMSFGAWASVFVTVMLDVAVFGGGVPNLVIASQNLELLGLRLGGSSIDVSYCYTLVGLGMVLCPIMWLGSPKDMKWVTTLSVASVVGVAVSTWTCMLLDHSPTTPAASISNPSLETFAITYGILAFQFDIHPMVLTIQVDMRNKQDLGCAIMIGFIVTGGLFLVTTGIAALQYGQATRLNVLQGLPPSILLFVDVLLVTLQICLSMVVGASAMFQEIEDRIGVPRDFNWRRCATRTGLTLFTVLIGEAVPRVDIVMSLVGGALTGPLMFVFPPLLYARCRQMQGAAPLSRFEAGLLVSVVLLGIAATCSATFYSLRDAVRYAQFSPSCL
ncbi:uncharacterized protein [Periplaneta americana]|uniref:uncharacterized protein n=1 Tax=Periplaneta americana TaxID=6978 RepID=UPI0037E88C76